jgi:hypothetical protein
MTKKETLHAEIDRLSEHQLDELFQILNKLTGNKRFESKKSLMAALKTIKINAPEDFASNLDSYENGEKGVKSDLH